MLDHLILYHFWILCCFLLLLFLTHFTFCVSVWVVSVDVFSSSLVISLAVLSLLMNLLKVFFIYLTVDFKNSSIFIWFFSYSVLLKFPVWSYMLLFFSIRSFNTSVMVFNIFLSESFIISVVIEPGSADCFAHWKCIVFLAFSYALWFLLLKIGYLVYFNRDWDKQLLVLEIGVLFIFSSPLVQGLE